SKSGLLGFKVATIGLYYNLVTPLASGSQPMQIYTLSKSKVSVSKAIAIVVNKTVVFQTIVTLYCGFLIFVNINSLRNELNPVLILVSTGVTMNIIMLCIGFLIVYSPNKTKKIMKVTISLLKKIKMFKFVEKKEVELEKFIDEYNYSINAFIKDKRALIKSMALTVIQLSMYFSIAFCIYKALRLTGDSYWHILTLQVFLYMAVSPIPTPGNVGANEIAFFTIFKGVFPELVIGYAVFLYGIVIYYLMLIVCGILTIIAHYTMDKKKKIYSKI
ncbi:MAG: lysylphosphatidylglycerol synthase transmembrane domain-containing protein, partial [Paraclostridium sp.]